MTVMTKDAPVKTYDELRRIVTAVEPVIRAGAAQAEARRYVPETVVDALRSQGLFRIWIPEAFGGWEVDPVTAFRVFEDISAIDSAAGWLVQMSAGVSGLGAFFGNEAVREIYSDPDNIFSDTFAAPAQATPVEGGYTVRGQIPWSSNCKVADWFFCTGMVMEGGEPKMTGGHPVMKVLALPTSEIEVVDNWNVTGMRGTGSHDVKMTGVFVPEHRAADMMPLARPASDAWPEAFGNMTVWHIIASVAVPSLGIGRAALDSFVELAKTRVPANEESTLDTQALHHYRLGEAKATLAAARALMYRSMEEVWASASAGHLITDEQKGQLQLAGSFGARAACDAIELIAPSAGGSAIREDGELNRHLRDLRTITSHAYIKTDRYQDVGALTLGQPPSWGFFAF